MWSVFTHLHLSEKLTSGCCYQVSLEWPLLLWKRMPSAWHAPSTATPPRRGMYNLSLAPILEAEQHWYSTMGQCTMRSCSTSTHPLLVLLQYFQISFYNDEHAQAAWMIASAGWSACMRSTTVFSSALACAMSGLFG